MINIDFLINNYITKVNKPLKCTSDTKVIIKIYIYNFYLELLDIVQYYTVKSGSLYLFFIKRINFFVFGLVKFELHILYSTH